MKITRHITPTCIFLLIPFFTQTSHAKQGITSLSLSLSLSLSVSECVFLVGVYSKTFSAVTVQHTTGFFFSFMLGKETSSHDVTFHMLSHAPARLKNFQREGKKKMLLESSTQKKIEIVDLNQDFYFKIMTSSYNFS